MLAVAERVQVPVYIGVREAEAEAEAEASYVEAPALRPAAYHTRPTAPIPPPPVQRTNVDAPTFQRTASSAFRREPVMRNPFSDEGTTSTEIDKPAFMRK